MRPLAFLVTVATVATVACNNSSKSPPPTQTLALADCAKGWWLYSVVSPCKDYCGQPAAPECAQADCTARAAIGYLPNGTLVNVFITYSRTASSMSSSGDQATQAYQVLDGAIQVTPPGKPLTAQCKTSGLTIGYADYVRPSVGLATALDQTEASGVAHWTGVPVPK